MGLPRWFRRLALVVVGIALVLAIVAAVRGDPGSSASVKQINPINRKATPTTRPADRKAVPTTIVRLTVTPKVLAAFKAADTKQVAAFASAEATIQAGRAANDLAVSQRGGRAARDAFFALDADLRKITFPVQGRPLTKSLQRSLGRAIVLFDQQNAMKDQASFVALDDEVGWAVVAVRRDLANLRTGLRIPNDTTTSTTDKSFFDRG